MRNRAPIGLLVALMVLSGCGAAIRPSDWCYFFNFRDDDHSMTIHQGTYTPGAGFSPDAAGFFSLEYTHSEPVTPHQVIFKVERGDQNMVPIQVNATASAFGLESGMRNTTVPADATSTDLSLFPGAGTGTSATLAMYGVSTRTFFLNGILVLGNGDNPFPESNCGSYGQPVPTPVQVIIPEAEMLEGLAGADTDLAGVDVALDAPDGLPLLPAETGAVLFSYAKWITAPATANELMGPFAPVYYHMGYFIAADMALVGIYIVVYGAVYAARWVIWLYKSILEIIATIGGIGIIGGIILLIIFGILFFGWLAQQIGLPEWLSGLLGG